MSLVFRAMDRRLSYLDNKADNAARMCTLGLIYETRGTGELTLSRPVPFGVRFLDEPLVGTGLVSVGRLTANAFPQVTVGVDRFQRSRRGFYIGAWLFFVVDSFGYRYPLHHHFTFQAVALKTVAGDDV